MANSLKRRFITLVLALMMVFSLGVEASAATNPSATLIGTTQTIKRGKTGQFRFYLNSGSYKRKSGRYRAGTVFYVTKSVNGQTIGMNKMIKKSGSYYDVYELDYSGAGAKTVTVKTYKNYPTGTYKLRYPTYKYLASSGWKRVSNKSVSFKVTK